MLEEQKVVLKGCSDFPLLTHHRFFRSPPEKLNFCTEVGEVTACQLCLSIKKVFFALIV